MLDRLTDKWWLFVVRGLLAIMFGVIAFARPGAALAALIVMFGVYALIDGFLGLAGCLSFSETKFRWWLLFEGLIGIAAGVLTFMNPGATAMVLLTFLGVWLILSGVMRIVAAFELRKAIEGEWLLGLAGLCSVAAGVLTFISPIQTAFAWLWVMGLYSVVAGIAMLCLGLRLRMLGHIGDFPHKPRKLEGARG